MRRVKRKPRQSILLMRRPTMLSIAAVAPIASASASINQPNAAISSTKEREINDNS